MSEARIKIEPTALPSAFGNRVTTIISSTELDGSLLCVSLVNERDTIQIRCTPEWALDFAETLKRQVERCAEHRKGQEPIGWVSGESCVRP